MNVSIINSANFDYHMTGESRRGSIHRSAAISTEVAGHIGTTVNHLRECLQCPRFMLEGIVFDKHIRSEHAASDFAVIGTMTDKLLVSVWQEGLSESWVNGH
jgi:hypothetical protein